MSILKDLVSGVTGPVADAIVRWREVKGQERLRKLELKEAVHKRQIELISQGLAADATWELAQIKNSGWKDEFTLLTISIPMVLCFIPYTQPYVVAGFEALQDTPAWYQLMLVAIYFATYGIRYWRRQQYDTE